MAVRASCPYCGRTLRESNTDNVDVKDLGDHLCASAYRVSLQGTSIANVVPAELLFS